MDFVFLQVAAIFKQTKIITIPKLRGTKMGNALVSYYPEITEFCCSSDRWCHLIAHKTNIKTHRGTTRHHDAIKYGARRF